MRTHRTVSRNLLRFFRARPVETWTSDDLETYVQQRLEEVAPTTVNGELKNLEATLRFAVEEKLIPEMPFKIRMVPVVQRRTARIFTREEIQHLLDCADDRTRTLLLIASATGMFVSADVIAELDRYRRSLKHNSDSDWVFQDKHKPGQRWRESGNSYYGIHKAFKKAGAGLALGLRR